MVRFAIWDLLLWFLLRRGFHWAIPWVGRTITGSATLSLHSRAAWVWQGGLFALLCFFIVLSKWLVCYFQLITRKVRRMRFFSVIFPTWGCKGVLTKRGKKKYDFHSWYFQALCALRALLTCWNIGKFQMAGEVSLLQTGYSAHLSYWIMEGTIKGKGIKKDRGPWTRREECLQVIYFCNTSGKLPKTTPKASWILKVEQPLLMKFQVGFHEDLWLFSFSAWFLLLVTCPFLGRNNGGYHFPSAHCASWELHNVLRNVRTGEDSSIRATIYRKTSHPYHSPCCDRWSHLHLYSSFVL